MSKQTLSIIIITLLSVVILTSHSAVADRSDLPADKRIKLLKYDSNDIYTIYTLYGYQTNIEFAKSEQIQTISVGERSLWQIVPSGHRLFIRPMDDNVTTNMTVITDRRTYQFDLKSGAGELSSNPRMVYVAKFQYPKGKPKPLPMAVRPAPQAVAVAPRPAATPPPRPVAVAKPMVTMPPAQPIRTITPPESRPVELNRFTAPVAPPPPPREIAAMFNTPETRLMDIDINYDYTFTGPDKLAPMQLYDDGQSTYIRFSGKASDMPKLYALDGGKKLPLVYHQAGSVVISNSVHTYMLLDYGADKNQRIYLYNEQRMPAGI